MTGGDGIVEGEAGEDGRLNYQLAEMMSAGF